MLSRKNRVKTSSFRYSTGLGRSFFVDQITLRVTKTGSTHPPECAVIVSKKVAKTAVVRNRIRRKVYGALTTYVPLLPNGFRFYFYPKQEMIKLFGIQMNNALSQLLEKTKLLHIKQ